MFIFFCFVYIIWNVMKMMMMIIMKQKNTRLDRNENAFSENGFSLYSILYKSIYMFWNFTIYYLVLYKKKVKWICSSSLYCCCKYNIQSTVVDEWEKYRTFCFLENYLGFYFVSFSFFVSHSKFFCIYALLAYTKAVWRNTCALFFLSHTHSACKTSLIALVYACVCECMYVCTYTFLWLPKITI